MAVDYQIRPITVEEYHRMGEAGLFDDGERVELLDGELILMAPIGHIHGFSVRSLAQTFIEGFGKRSIVDMGQNVILGTKSEPQPDLMLLAAKPSRYRDAVPTTEDVLLLVEVSDTSLRYDRGRKLDVYAREGIREVWIVDLNGARVERYTDLADARYTTVEEARRGESLAPRAFPDDAIAIDEFLP